MIVIGESFPNEVFEYYVEKAESKGENKLELIGSLWILRHLITRFYDRTGQHLKKLLYSHLKVLVEDEDFEVRAIFKQFY